MSCDAGGDANVAAEENPRVISSSVWVFLWTEDGDGFQCDSGDGTHVRSACGRPEGLRRSGR